MDGVHLISWVLIAAPLRRPFIGGKIYRPLAGPFASAHALLRSLIEVIIADMNRSCSIVSLLMMFFCFIMS